MRKIIFCSLILIFFYSCSDEEKGNVCPEGYFGKNCDAPVNVVFTGTWDVEQLCSTSGEESYTIDLLPSAEDPREFVITGMWGESSESIVVIVDEDDRRKFYQGTQPLGESGFTIEVLEGEINKAGNHMTIEYIIYSGPVQVESCTASCSLILSI